MPITARVAAKSRSASTAPPVNSVRRVVDYRRRQKKGGIGVVIFVVIACVAVLFRETIFPGSMPGRLDMNEKSSRTTAMAAASGQTNVQSSSKISTKGRSRQKTTKDRRSTDEASATVKVISYSMYGGDNARYTDGILAVAAEARTVFPGWQVRIYHDDQVPSDVLTELAKQEHVKLVNAMMDLPEWAKDINPMAWRFLVASDPTVEAYIVRDADSLLLRRDKAAVDEWLASGKGFHMMRDHPFHHPGSFAPILGGMWGGLHRAVPQMDMLLREKGMLRGFKADQNFLWNEVLPLVKDDCFQHDSFYCRESGGIAFPIEGEKAYDFIGDRVFPIQESSTKPSRLAKCMLNPNNHLRYMDCLQDRKERMTVAKNSSNKHQSSFPDTSYIGKMKQDARARKNSSLLCDPGVDPVGKTEDSFQA